MQEIVKQTTAAELQAYLEGEHGEARSTLKGPKGFPKGFTDYADKRKRKRRISKASRRRNVQTRNGQHL